MASRKNAVRFLLVHSPAPQREQVVRLLTDQGLDVQVCDNAQHAKECLANTKIRAALVIPPPGGDSTVEFLDYARERFPRLRISLIAGDNGHPPSTMLDTIARIGAAARNGKPMMLRFPPDSDASSKTQVKPATEILKTIELRTVKYPVCFQHARYLFEREFLMTALSRNKGNITRTAEFVGMARRNLQTRMRLLGITRESLVKETGND